MVTFKLSEIFPTSLLGFRNVSGVFQLAAIRTLSQVYKVYSIPGPWVSGKKGPTNKLSFIPGESNIPDIFTHFKS